jgi:hypothetical protein
MEVEDLENLKRVPLEYEKRSLVSELTRMDSLISNGSNDSSLNSMEIDDQFVGLNLDKNFNESDNNNKVNILKLDTGASKLMIARNRFVTPGSGSLLSASTS